MTARCARSAQIWTASIDHGLRVPAVKWLMVQALFTGGVGIYGFYALQPYLLELYGDPQAYQIAGISAAIAAGAQILGGVAAPQIRRLFKRRTSALADDRARERDHAGPDGPDRALLGRDRADRLWGLLFAATTPIRQAYLNGLIPSRQRATILSFDSMMTSGGGVWAQPVLGKSADVWGYATSYVISAGISLLALPFIALSRRENAPADLVASPLARRSRSRGR